jgi:hypothetical protein
MCGFALSVIAHVMSLAGKTFPPGKWVWGLHFGILAIGFCDHLILKRINPDRRYNDLSIAWPRWLRGTVYALLIYALFNMILYIVSGTEQSTDAALIRFMSAGWMSAYAFILAAQYSTIHPKGIPGRVVASDIPPSDTHPAPYFARRGSSAAFRRLDASDKTGQGTDSTIGISEDREDRL